MAIRADAANTFNISATEGPFLIVGLGNIGEDYSTTRHNAGFMTIDHLVAKEDLGSFKEKSDLNADILETSIAGEKVIFAKPRTFMNKSGLAVIKLQNYFSVNDPRILVIYDDIDIDFGTIRTRVGGSSGGHNGIKSVTQVLGEDFHRIRIGVKNEHLENVDTADFVLQRFSRGEMNDITPILDTAGDMTLGFINSKFEETSVTL